jgi:hypothetical protein
MVILICKNQNMYAWLVRLPPPRRRVTQGENCACRRLLNFADFLRLQLMMEHHFSAGRHGISSQASDARRCNASRITRTFRASKICQTVASGAALVGIPATQEHHFSTGPRPTHIFSSGITLLPGEGRRKSEADEADIS